MFFTHISQGPIPKARKQANGSGMTDRPVGPAKLILEKVVAQGFDDTCCMILGHGGTMPNRLSLVKPNDTPLRCNSWRGTMPAMNKAQKPFTDIAERLRWHRALEGLEQKDYAARAGLHRSQLSNWENGDYRLSLDGALALRRTYGLSLDFMFEGIDDALPMTLRVAWRDRPRVR